MAKTRSLRKRRRSSRRRGLALSTISVLTFAGFTGILVAALSANQLESKLRIKAQRNGLIEAQAERRAHELDLAIESYVAGIRALARDPETVALLKSGEDGALRKRETEIAAINEGALRVRLIPQGTAQLSKTSTPHFGYACMDLLRKTNDLSKHAPVELHAPKTPQKHVDIIEPVVDVDGSTIVGHIQLALDVGLVQRWVDKIAEGAYVELRQRSNPPVLIAKSGEPDLVSVTEAVIWPRKGTLWEFAVWEREAVPPSLLTPQSMAIVGVSITLGALLVFLLNKSFTRSVRIDLTNLVDMAVASARGDKSHQYSLRMQEFKDAARKLQDLPASRSMTRERDDNEDAVISLKPEREHDTQDPMFISQASMSVEEVDEATAEAAISQVSIPAPEITMPEPAAPTAPATFAAGGTTPPAEIFKEYDIRGIFGSSLTVDHAMMIGRALGSEAITRGLQRIAFGRDGRLSGPELGAAFVKGLQSSGIDVMDIGMVPTPVLYYAANELTEGTGVMMTGSHNPADYNGFKMMLGGDTLFGDDIRGLRTRIEEQDFAEGSGGYQTNPVLKKYVERILADVKLKRPLKVVVDCGNGVAGIVAPKLFEALGCEVVELFCNVDGNFPNHHPDPSQPKNLQDVIEAVRVQRADLGLAFDGDGDRLGVVSSDGSMIWPDRLMMLFAEDVLKRNHGAKIIFDIKCSSNLTRVIWEKGGEPLMWKTGHSLIKKKMKESGALLAGEMSGHIFFKERWYGFDDALYAAARLLEILSNDVRQPRVVLGTLPNGVNTPELRIELPEGEHFSFMDKLMDHAEFDNANVIMIDGIRADFEDGWGLVRASNTTPCLILRFEGKDKDALNRVQDQFRQVMLAIEPNLKLPF